MSKLGHLVTGALQGYLIDKATAENGRALGAARALFHGITNIDQMKNPKIAKLFDTDGDGKANLARESGIETPTAEDLARLDRKRKGKKLSNEDWVSAMKDGTTHLAYPEHAVDLDTGAVVAAELHPADEGDTTTLPKTDAAPTAEDPAECVGLRGALPAAPSQSL